MWFAQLTHVVPSVEDLTDEAFTIIAAAADTTGHAMAILTYHVVANPTIYRSLTLELKTAFHSHDHDHLNYTTLEKLPYLSAVIKEGLRLSYGTPRRLPRTINTPTATFNGYTVPKGTVVGMSTYLMHRNPNLFPDPDTFDPCRWLNPVTAKRLEKYLVSFSRGSTQCVGMRYVLPLSSPFTFLPLSLPLHYSVQSSTPNKIHNHKISLQCTIKLQGMISQASHISSYTSASEPFFVHSKTCGSLRRRRKIWSLMIFRGGFSKRAEED
jgi:hypothetical protein